MTAATNPPYRSADTGAGAAPVERRAGRGSYGIDAPYVPTLMFLDAAAATVAAVVFPGSRSSFASAAVVLFGGPWVATNVDTATR